MLKKYLPLLILGPVSNALWIGWALPQINEQGTFEEVIQWLCVQGFIPIFFALLLLLRVKLVYWLMVVYSGFIILFATGMLGWAFIGSRVPLSIYAVSTALFVMGFGILFHALKDLNVGKPVKYYGLEN